MNVDRIGRYSLLRALGSGGMGTVYEAVDENLDRRVAIKGLHGDPDPARRARLRREALALAKLDHPSVTRVYEIVTEADRDWVVMEHVEGQTLADIAIQGPLPVDELLRIGEAIASVLAAAHRLNIVHRDIKVENVMVTPDGVVKVLDFGLAQVDPHSKARSDRLTSAGMVVGTSKSMSPEQARGLTVDPRSDIFSLGSLLYELATGRQAFAGGSPMETMIRVAQAEYEPLEQVAPHLPAAFRRVITTCLALEPEHRYSTAQDVVAALRDVAATTEATDELPATKETTARRSWQFRWRPLVVGVVTVLAVATAAAIWLGWSAPSRPKVVAMLPVEDSRDGATGRLAVAAVTDAVSSRIARLHDVVVVSAGEVRAAFGEGDDLREVAHRLAADELVRASLAVTERPAEARLTLTRIDGHTGEVIWRDDTLVRTDNPLLVQDRIAAMLANAYDGFALDHEVGRPDNVDAAAYTLYLDVLDRVDRGVASPNFEDEVPILEAAIRRDPRFVPALTLLATMYARRHTNLRDESAEARRQKLLESAELLAPDDPAVLSGLATRALETGDEARALALAVRLTRSNPGDYRGWWLLGAVQLRQNDPNAAETSFLRAADLYPGWQSWWYVADARIKTGDFAGARTAANLLLERRPGSPYGRSKLAEAALYAGRFDEARSLYEEFVESRGARVDFIHLGNACFYQGDLDRASELYREAIALDPNDSLAHANLADVLLMDDRHEEARASYRHALELAERQRATGNDDRDLLETRARCLAWLGRSTEAVKAIEEALKSYGSNPATLFFASAVHAINGDHISALVWAEHALDAHAPVVWFTHGPEFAKLRDDPELRALLDRYR